MTEIAYIVTLLWSWSYGSWIYSHLWTQCLSLLTLWVRIPFRRVILDTTICYKVCEWLAAGRWFSPGTPLSFTNKTYRHDITEILWKVALSTINQTYFYTIEIQIIKLTSLIKLLYCMKH